MESQLEQLALRLGELAQRRESQLLEADRGVRQDEREPFEAAHRIDAVQAPLERQVGVVLLEQERRLLDDECQLLERELVPLGLLHELGQRLHLRELLVNGLEER